MLMRKYNRFVSKSRFSSFYLELEAAVLFSTYSLFRLMVSDEFCRSPKKVKLS